MTDHHRPLTAPHPAHPRRLFGWLRRNYGVTISRAEYNRLQHTADMLDALADMIRNALRGAG